MHKSMQETLGEVESALRDHQQIREDVSGDEILVAYVVPARDAATTTPIVPARQLRDGLRRRLPDCMLPATGASLKCLPLTLNGKITPKRLMTLPADRPSRRHVPPITPNEQTLAAIWGDVLRLDRVGLDDDFFESGGPSLQTVRLLSRLQSIFNVLLSLASLFAQPTLGAMRR